jgi:hypothetical protein
MRTSFRKKSDAQNAEINGTSDVSSSCARSSNRGKMDPLMECPFLSFPPPPLLSCFCGLCSKQEYLDCEATKKKRGWNSITWYHHTSPRRIFPTIRTQNIKYSYQLVSTWQWIRTLSVTKKKAWPIYVKASFPFIARVELTLTWSSGPNYIRAWTSG